MIPTRSAHALPISASAIDASKHRAPPKPTIAADG
jgi:hypothetical protein